MRKLTYIVVTLCIACAKSSEPLPGDSVSADGGVTLSPPRLSSAPREPLGAVEAALFPPELIMEHQAAIGIQSAQRDAITKEVGKGQADRMQIQWQLDAAKEKLIKILDTEKVDEAKAADAASHVMEFENQVKSSHLDMLVRVKNLLTPDQQKQLRALR